MEAKTVSRSSTTQEIKNSLAKNIFVRAFFLKNIPRMTKFMENNEVTSRNCCVNCSIQEICTNNKCISRADLKTNQSSFTT